MSNKLKNANVYVRRFEGAKVRCMKDRIKPSLREKAQEVNDYLSKLCMERNIYLIDHSKTLKTQHLNGSKLHLIKGDAATFTNTVCKFLSKFFN